MIKNESIKENLKYPIAVHEAGHAIINMLLGYDVKSIDISDKDCYTCHENIIDVDDRAMSALAGMIAENLIFHTNHLISELQYCDDKEDFEFATSFKKVCYKHRFNEVAYKDRMYAKAEMLLSNYIPLIQCIANEFDTKEFLDGKKVQKMYRMYTTRIGKAYMMTKHFIKSIYNRYHDYYKMSKLW